MTDILDDQVDELLRNAEQRLKAGTDSSHAAAVAVTTNTNVKVDGSPGAGRISDCTTDVTVRVASQPQPRGGKNMATASSWFDMPRTNLTPQFKRDWQLLRMRGVLDPKHQKKALRATPPEFSQVGEVIAGPTEFYSARLSRKERKPTFLGEAMMSYDSSKFATKYAGIQKQKTSGKKGFYQKIMSQRRQRRG